MMRARRPLRRCLHECGIRPTRAIDCAAAGTRTFHRAQGEHSGAGRAHRPGDHQRATANDDLVTRVACSRGIGQHGSVRDTLRSPVGGSVRDGVVSDLARYYNLTPEQVVDRCLHWEDDSVKEWRSASSRPTTKVAEFYNSVTSWSFDLMWYSYLQTEAYGYPEHVIIADQMPLPDGARVLDFGSGVGVTLQSFAPSAMESTSPMCRRRR